jgi:TPR repeat protein
MTGHAVTGGALSKVARGATILGLCLGLGGCVTARPTTSGDLRVLAVALTEPVEDLRSRADAGRADAQYALSMLHAYGMRGVVPDRDQAERLRRKALAARGSTPITTYIAGLHGKPGRVSTIYTPRYELDAVQAMRIDQCAAALARRDGGQTGADACGGPEAFAGFSSLWVNAK